MPPKRNKQKEFIQQKDLVLALQFLLHLIGTFFLF